MANVLDDLATRVATANDYATPRATAQTLIENLATIETEDLSGTRYYMSENLQQPFPLDVDENARPTIAFNMIFTKDKNA